MSASPFAKGPRCRAVTWVAACAAGVLLAACGPIQEPSEEDGARLASHAQALSSHNGLSLNGLSLNGLSLNGLSLNGLSLNGLSTRDFADWFQQDAERGDQVMRYLIHCAVPAGEVRLYTDPGTGEAYVWTGGLGLAPDWAGGASATEAEQQVVTACLAAHTNKYGVHVPISVLGQDARGRSIAVTPEEQKQFTWKESCFFGNVFNGGRLYVGRDHNRLSRHQSTSRACSVFSGRLDTPEDDDDTANTDTGETAGDIEDTRRHCTPLVYVGRCDRYCTLDRSKTFYASCTYGGVTYRPLTTHLRHTDVAQCGDGICQPSESCGRGDSFDSCRKDCGPCN